jgi:hypothetical protein
VSVLALFAAVTVAFRAAGKKAPQVRKRRR